MHKPFFKVKTLDQVFEIIDRFGPLGEETVPLEQSVARVLSRDLVSSEDLPGFFRSAMDGYAVNSRDTFGGTESFPAFFEIAGEIRMGEVPGRALGPGEAMRISTGGMLPSGSDAVVMVEYCQPLDETTLEVTRAVSPLENVIQPSDDFERGAVVLRSGRRLRPQDIGVMAGLGQSEVQVYKQPRVGILSTGDEIVPIHETPGPGRVRDINRYTLDALCRRMGAIPVYVGLCGDDGSVLREKVREGLRRTDTVWISGGSSVGTRDLTLEAFGSIPGFELLVHGVSISPGKPTIIGRTGAQPVVGLPGHTSSALVVAQVFLSRLIRRLTGSGDISGWLEGEIEADLSRNIESAAGREDFVRVKLVKEADRWKAHPVFGKSGLISILVESDGLVRVGMNTEGLYEGQKVRVIRFDSGGP